LESVLAGLAPGDADDTPGLVQREDGSFLVDGALTISEFADSFGIDDDDFASKDYDTLAGLVLDCMGSIPKVGEHCDWGGLRIEVMDMDGNRIDKLLCSVIDHSEAKEPEIQD
jgi:putative hemolysin